MLELRLTLHGRVQGMSFREKVLGQIEHHLLDVKGEISLLPNGTTQVVAQGDLETLKMVRQIVCEGDPKSYIRDMEESLVPISEISYDDFQVSL